MENPYATLGFLLKRAHQSLRSRLDNELRTIGLTTPQYAVLTYLEASPGATNAELARRTFVTPQTMQVILVGLEKAELVLRRPHPEHRRMQNTELTPTGRKVLKRAVEIVDATEDLLREALGPNAADEMQAALTRIAEKLGEDADDKPAASK